MSPTEGIFVFICIGAHAGDDPLKYEIEGEGVGAQGTYLVKVTVIQKKSKLDVDVIKKCAVHGVLFKGFSSQTSRTRQKPLAGSKEELKSFLMKVKEESEKAGLKLSIQKTKIMASGPITSWQIDGETMETVRDFFGGHKITADGDCSHEIKRCLLLGSKVMTNLDSILKSRDIALPTKVRLVKAMVFPVVMYGCESWTVKKAERQRIDAFELCVGEDS